MRYKFIIVTKLKRKLVNLMIPGHNRPPSIE